ncbi:MAG: hypothetical protein P9L88_01585 [Candidatus Tantalella remota]|nr:hypothetical protein [Candidatus Tantalella remota]
MSNNPKKILIFKVVTVLINVAIVLIVLEISLRIWGPPYYRFNNDSMEYYTNPRGYHDALGKEGSHTIYGLRHDQNTRGYRLPDNFVELYPRGRQENYNRENLILGLGDSFAYGRGVRFKDMYMTLLEESLNKSGYDTKVKNCGRQADDLEETILVYNRESSRRKYDIVLYGFVLNDFGLPEIERISGFEFIDQNDPDQPFDPWRQKIRIYGFVRHMLDKRKLHNVTTEVYLEAFEGEYAEKKFNILKEFNRDVRGNGSRMVIVLFPLLYDFNKYPFKAIHDKLTGFCEKEGILLVDLLPAFSRYKDSDLWVNPTDHHPNEIANRIAAEEIYVFLVDNDLVRED